MLQSCFRYHHHGNWLVAIRRNRTVIKMRRAHFSSNLLVHWKLGWVFLIVFERTAELNKYKLYSCIYYTQINYSIVYSVTFIFYICVRLWLTTILHINMGDYWNDILYIIFIRFHLVIFILMRIFWFSVCVIAAHPSYYTLEKKCAQSYCKSCRNFARTSKKICKLILNSLFFDISIKVRYKSKFYLSFS